MPDIEIVIVKRAHQWVSKRGDKAQDHTCRTCGKRRAQVATAVCFEEEIEREVGPPDV